MAIQFTLDNKASDGTSLVTHLLSWDHKQYISTFTPRELEAAFGPGDEGLCDDEYNREKGYTDPERYWVAEDGSSWGIAWRWGEPRLRGGTGGRHSDGTVHPPKTTANEFVEFLKIELSRKACPSCGFRKEPGDPVHGGFRCGCWQK